MFQYVYIRVTIVTRLFHFIYIRFSFNCLITDKALQWSYRCYCHSYKRYSSNIYEHTEYFGPFLCPISTYYRNEFRYLIPIYHRRWHLIPTFHRYRNSTPTYLTLIFNTLPSETDFDVQHSLIIETDCDILIPTYQLK